MEELSYAEIAGILHTTPQAVRGRLARARAELGEAMTFMAIEGVDDVYLLPCGQDAAILWEHVATGELNEHELECEHCQAASAGFIALREVTGELTEADVVPARDLTERIMRAVRAERPARHVRPCHAHPAGADPDRRSGRGGRGALCRRSGRRRGRPGPARWSRSPTGRTAGA